METGYFLSARQYGKFSTEKIIEVFPKGVKKG
jgi:hypothetical protein